MKMQKVSRTSLTSSSDRVSHVVAPTSATNSEQETTMTNNDNRPRTNLEIAVEWSLAHDVEYTRGAIIKRARWLAEKLTRLADGLETDPSSPSTRLANCRATASSWTPGARSSASRARR